MQPPFITTHNGMSIIGLAVRTNNAAEANPETAKISGLMQRFFAENCTGHILNKTDENLLVAVYTNYESDHTGAYDFIIGVPVTNLDVIPSGMTGVHAKSGKYALFSGQGAMPQTIISTWHHIWKYFAQGGTEQRAFGADLQIHDQRKPDTVEIYIGIKP